MNLEIFEKQKKFLFTENKVVYGSLTIFFILAWLFSKTDFETIENLIHGLVISTLLLGIYFKFTQHKKYKRINGKLSGKIEFYKDKLKIFNRKIRLDQIKKIDFEFYDYEGKLISPMRGDLNPALSNGVNNSIKVDLMTNEQIHFNIKLNYEGQIKLLKDYFVEYMNKGKISAYRVTTILGLNNYHEIQDFKEEHYHQHAAKTNAE